jgi:hypothetical protein
MLGAISARLKAHFMPGCGIRILGGSSDQSKRMYDNVSRFDMTAFADTVVGEATQEKTRYRGGSNIEILMASMKSVRGPHVPILMLDEVDEFTKRIYTAALAIAQSSKKVRATVEQFSTAHNPNGIMQQLIEESAKSGLKLYRWCIFEVLKPCPHTCTKENPYKRCADMVKYDQLNVPHRFSDVCACRAKKSRGYYSVEDLWQKFEHPMMSWESFAAEYLCEMPKTEDAVFPMMGPIHLIGEWPADEWRGAVGFGRQWRLVMGGDAGPVNSWIVWALLGRLYPKDEFDTGVIVHQFASSRKTAPSDFADQVVIEHERMGFPPAEALFTGPGSVPQDTYLATELDKRERRSRLFVHSTEQPEGRVCIRCDREGAEHGWAAIGNMLVLRADPEGKPRPALMFCRDAREAYDSLVNQQRKGDEHHGVAAVRYAIRGWERHRGWMLSRGATDDDAPADGFACGAS